ncbi:glycosyltransferase [Nitriliruptor alkaliphilus]|uniref:glycosyltransferase n=1 Tax=Nitriliruptor alkaliphilus TaxID=427918 RepID=UPI000696DFCC|nr:glycosyltransferase [Nitriliruptor alkaliphilus]
MRIVTYHPRAQVGDGGITTSVRRLSSAWARAGVDAAIAYDGRDGRRRDADGVEWIAVPHHGHRRARRPWRLRRALAGADLVVVNSAWSPSNVVAGAAARRAGVPYVLAPRGAYDPLILARRRALKRVWWWLFERRLVRSAAGVHVFFEEQRSDLAALGHTGPVIVAPNGVEVPDGPRWDGGSGGYLVFLGRFDPEHKGLDLLLHAMARLPSERRPRLRLHGPDWRGGKDQVRALVRHLHLDDVTVADAVYGDDKWQTLVRSRGLVYPSRWEGFGNSLAEAAALGVPTLATPYPLARFLGRGGGCLVVDADPGALARGLEQLGRPEAAEIGRRAAEIVTTELSWDAVARRWLEGVERLRS